MELMHTVVNYCSIFCNKLLTQLQQDILKQNRNMINTVGFSSLYCLPVRYKKGTDELFISSSAFIQLFWDNLCHYQNSKNRCVPSILNTWLYYCLDAPFAPNQKRQYTFYGQLLLINMCHHCLKT